MTKLLHLLQTSRGQTALVGMLIITAIILLLVLSISYTSRQELAISGQETVNRQTTYLTDSCLDEALIRLQRDENYSGGNVALFGGTCQIAVTAQSNRRTINVTAQKDDHVRRLEAVVKLGFDEEHDEGGGNDLRLESWRELIN